MKSEGIWRKKDLLGPLGKNISPLRFCFISPGQQKERALSLASLATPQYELVRLLWKQQPNEELRTRGCRLLLPAKESRQISKYSILSCFPANFFNLCLWEAGGDPARGVQFLEEGVDGFLGIHFTTLLCRECMGFD